MNTSGLAKHYGKLTAWERLPLILAALKRGDDAEADRLTCSAPTRPAAVPHYYSLWEGLTLLTFCHLGRQLELGCRLAGTVALLASGQVEHEAAHRQIRMLAFQFALEADAWQLLSAELQMDPEAILGHLPGRDLVRYVEEAARRIAFTPEEALAYLRQQTPAVEMETAADIARGMKAFLAERALRWY
jgi:hypothetical protein